MGGAMGGLLSVAGLYLGSFALFLTGSLGTGIYMAAQGSLFIFVVLIFFLANRQNKIDEEFGVAEDDD